ncbi:hypothetical protein WR30_00230 [Burkholderia contaminans FFH2055]|nr:hypothetical protein WR30_00230 [Burkholderia contaminans FFH2055]
MPRVRYKAMSCGHDRDLALAHATTSHAQPIGCLKEVRRRTALVQGGTSPMRADPIRSSRHTLASSGQPAVAFERRPVTRASPAQHGAITRAMLHMRQRCLTAGGMFRLASEA